MRKPYLRGRGPHFPILDTITQYDFEPGYVVFAMPSPKRLRIKVGELIVADSTEALVLQESDHLPVYYFPVRDVEESFLMPSTTRTECPYKGVASHYSLNTGVPSSRRVQVFLGGEMVADSRKGVFLFETGHPTRYYLPIADTRLELLSPSRYVSRCPYKGLASYYHLTLNGKRHENLVWYYPEPVHESARIKGLVCFYNEFVDRILVDGVEQPKPETASSHGYY
jgi:uncharacterized protein (DUF427 family)